MCLDIAFYSSLELIDSYFPHLIKEGELDYDLQAGAHILGLSYKRFPVIVFEDGNYKRKIMEWGVIAEYMDTPEKIQAMRPKMLNARAEKILEDKRSFWHRLRKKRCLIPVTGIYEHREIKGWTHKVPYHIKLKDQKMFCLPGMFHYNEKVPSDPETGEVRGMFTLITREANEVMRLIHNGGQNAFRMPLFLPKELQLKWLEPDLTDSELGELLAFNMPPSELDYWPVYTIRSSKPRPDGKEKIDPYAWPDLPALGNDEGISPQKVLF